MDVVSSFSPVDRPVSVNTVEEGMNLVADEREAETIAVGEKELTSVRGSRRGRPRGRGGATRGRGSSTSRRMTHADDRGARGTGRSTKGRKRKASTTLNDHAEEQVESAGEGTSKQDVCPFPNF